MDRASRRTDFSTSQSKIGCWNIPRRSFSQSPDVVASVVVPEGELIPKRKRAITTLPASAGSVRTTSSISSSASLTTFPPRRRMICIARLAWAGSSAWIATARTVKSMRSGCAIRSAWISIQRTSHSGLTTTRLTAWATISRPANSNRIASAGLDFGFPVDMRRQDPHQRVQERYSAAIGQ